MLTSVSTMELNKTSSLVKSSGTVVEANGNSDDSTDLVKMYQEINQMYTERLQKINELGDSTELRTKLLYMWVTDLLEQNASLVETVSELEKVAAERVLLLEEKLRKSSSSVHRYMNKFQADDGHTTMSLRALVASLEVDIGSLLELIRRARTEGCWDIRGLVFHEVSYWDIFGCAPPPPSAPRKDESMKPPKIDAEMQNLKADLEIWKARAEKAEAEGKVFRETGSLENSRTLRLELDEARRLAAERAEKVLALEHKLAETEQRGKDVQATLAAEVAEKHDQVVQQRQRLQQLEEDLRLAHMQTHFRDEIIKGMRKEVKRFRSQLAVLDPSSHEASVGTCVHCGRSATPEEPSNIRAFPAKVAHVVNNGINIDGESQIGDVRGRVSDAPVDGVTT